MNGGRSSRRWKFWRVSGEILSHRERLILYRLAVTTLRTPDARSAQSNIVIVRFQSYAPTLRCRCVATTRLNSQSVKDAVVHLLVGR